MVGLPPAYFRVPLLIFGRATTRSRFHNLDLGPSSFRLRLRAQHIIGCSNLSTHFASLWALTIPRKAMAIRGKGSGNQGAQLVMLIVMPFHSSTQLCSFVRLEIIFYELKLPINTGRNCHKRPQKNLVVSEPGRPVSLVLSETTHFPPNRQFFAFPAPVSPLCTPNT